MVKGKGPVFPSPLVKPSDIDHLALKPDVEETPGYVFDAEFDARAHCWTSTTHRFCWCAVDFDGIHD